MGEDRRIDREGTDVWVCELTGPSHYWQWLCRPCAITKRLDVNQLGHRIWVSVIPRREIDGDCAACSLRRQAEHPCPDDSAHLRRERANVRDVGRVMRFVRDKKIIERTVE